MYRCAALICRSASCLTMIERGLVLAGLRLLVEVRWLEGLCNSVQQPEGRWAGCDCSACSACCFLFVLLCSLLRGLSLRFVFAVSHSEKPFMYTFECTRRAMLRAGTYITPVHGPGTCCTRRGCDTIQYTRARSHGVVITCCWMPRCLPRMHLPARARQDSEYPEAGGRLGPLHRVASHGMSGSGIIARM